MPPTLANGKICYVEIPAFDIQRSASFYSTVFGWRIRQRSDGHTAFDDTTGEVSGAWVPGRPPGSQPGLLLYVMVDSVAKTVDAGIADQRPSPPHEGPRPGAGPFARRNRMSNRAHCA
jgi:uncharacterized protein